MLWQHDPNQPIGTWTVVREDKRGLYVEGKLAKGVAKASEVLELMRSGAVDGLSIGFKTIKAKAASGGIRHIYEAISREISVAPFPDAAIGKGGAGYEQRFTAKKQEVSPAYTPFAASSGAGEPLSRIFLTIQFNNQRKSNERT
ncbi:phage head maturation protease [Phyllobacterium sp. 1468]|nr:phage head maturation protease [Phyllobacterium sp. 1468]